MTKSSKLLLINEKKLIQEEKERLRKLRIIQVREISKQNAALVRNAFQKEKNKEIKTLKQKHNAVKYEEKEEKINEMKSIVESHMGNIGQGHVSAVNYDDEGKEQIRLKTISENKEIASLRGKFAIQKHTEERKQQENKENAHIISRKFAIEQEKLRAAYVAKLPAPDGSKDEEELNKLIDKRPEKMVTLHEANVFATTRYHMPDTFVDKEIDDQVDARKDAIIEEQRHSEISEEHQRTNQERLEKARLRGKHALEKEILEDDYNDILGELNVLQKADREKRQKELINIPKEIFLPSWQRDQEKNEMQYDLERQFEKIYADSNLRTEDQVPQPVDIKQMEISQSNFNDTELDLTIVDDMSMLKKYAEVDEGQQANINSNFTIVSQATSKTQQENLALNKLLGKIRKQREDLGTKVSKETNDSITESIPQPAQIIHTEPNHDTDNKNESLQSATNLWSPKSKSDNSAVSEQMDDSEITLTNDSSKLESDIIEATERRVKDNDKKIIRGIMMSSHNVSSLHEIETRFVNRRNRFQDQILTDQNVIDANSSFNNNQNTATYSVCLSHASRDQMVAGPQELFNNNDKKLAIEFKQKQLHKQQQDLEKKLKDLEEKEAELEKSKANFEELNNQAAAVVNATPAGNNNNLNCKITSSGGIDSGNDHNYCSDTSTSPPSTARLNKQNKQLSSEDLKRIEYQKMILKMMGEKKARSALKSETEYSSSSSTSIDSAAQRIEERKRELLKKFDIPVEDPTMLSKKPPHCPSSNFQHQINQIINNDSDKHTVFSVDSGQFSSSSTNFSKKQEAANRQGNNNVNVQAVNLEVERLNNEVLNMSQLNKSKQDLIRQQQQIQLAEYLSGKISEAEYRQRLELLNHFQNTNKPLDMNSQDQMNNLFGLEFFDPNQNMSDVRDLSIENMFGLSMNQRKLSLETNPTFSSTSESSKADTTTNDGDETSSDSDALLSKEDISDDEDSQALIMSLLNSHKNSSAQIQTSSGSADWKRQFIQDQLEIVRKQKEQLLKQQTNGSQSTSNSSGGVNRSGRHGSAVNLHELSTIKEVDTPKSERNLKLNSSANANRNSNNLNLFDLQEMSSALTSANSSLENVTQLNETNLNTNNNNNQNTNSFNSQKLKSSSYSSLSDTSASSTSSSYFKMPLPLGANKSIISNNSFTSTSTPMNGSHTPQSNAKTLSLSTMREKQAQLFNASLFEYSNQNSSNEHTPRTSKLEYAAQIYDELSTQNLSISNNHQFTLGMSQANDESRVSAAFKSTSFKVDNNNSSIMQKSISIHNNNESTNSTSNTNMINSKKKWFDILATDDESSMMSNRIESEKINSINSDLMQQPLSSTSSTNTISNGQVDFSLQQYHEDEMSHEYSGVNTLIQHPLSKSELSVDNKSSYLQGADNLTSYNGDSYTDNNHNHSKPNKSSSEMDRTLQQYNPPPTKLNSTKKQQKPQKSILSKSSRFETESSVSGSILDDGSCMSSRTIDSCASYTQSYSNSHNSDIGSVTTPNPNTTGLFDRFLKNYTSSSSIQDEPDLSFVSSQGQRSGQVSPQRSNLQATQYSYSTSGVSSNSMANSNQMEKTLENLSLIQFQQKQLMKQFANVSPIENQKVAGSLGQISKIADEASSINGLLSIQNNSTRFGTLLNLEESKLDANRTDMQSTKISAQDSMTSFTTYSPRGSNLRNELSTIIQGPISESPDREQSSNYSIESALKTTNHYKSNFTHLTQLEQIESADETIQQYKPLEKQSIKNNHTNFFSNISCSRDDSLVSFEQHELTKCSPCIRIDKKQQPSPSSFNLNEINTNSTPFIPRPNNTTPSPHSIDEHRNKFKQFLDNINTSDLQMFGENMNGKEEELMAMSSAEDMSCYGYSNQEKNNETNDDMNDVTIQSGEN